MTGSAWRTAAIAIAVTLAAGAALVAISGASPLQAAAALARGAFASKAALGETLTRATGLVLCALAAVLAFRAGVLNVGLEGQFLSGAAAAAACGGALDAANPTVARLLCIAAAAAAGAAATVPAAWLEERRRVPAVLSTILLNLLAAAAVTWLVRGPLRDPAGDYPQSRALSEAERLAPLVDGARATAAPFAALFLAPLLSAFLARTRPGLLVRAVGEAPLAARAAGVPDARVRASAFAVSGALAGLGGGLEVLAITGRLYDPFTAGVGYAGIAAALLGGVRPVGAAAAALGLAALGAGASAMQRDAGVPASLSAIIPALAVLCVLAARGARARA